jgi:hypothetical protein
MASTGVAHVADAVIETEWNTESKELFMAVNYTTFQDSGLILPDGADIDEDIPFSTPNVDTSQNGVLSLVVDPTGDATLKIMINGTLLETYSFGTDAKRVLQENFSLSLLNTNNTLTLEVTGSGSLAMSDFHVLYKTP